MDLYAHYRSRTCFPCTTVLTFRHVNQRPDGREVFDDLAAGEVVNLHQKNKVGDFHTVFLPVNDNLL